MLLSDRRSVAANTTVENVFAGKAQEFLTTASVVEFAVVSSATGIYASVILGNAVSCSDQLVSEANHYPVFPDDRLTQAAGFRGDRIVLSIRNSTAGALTTWSVAKIHPVA